MGTDRKSYNQFCGLARALDRIGDRWSLLIVRELLLGEGAFRQIQDALPGVSPNLLSQRLSRLVTDGIVERTDAPQRSKAVRYRLTAYGAELEPIVDELIRWGSRWMMAGPGDDHVEPRWGHMALRALLTDDAPTGPTGVVRVAIDGVDLIIDVTPQGRRVRRGAPNTIADCTVTGSLPSILAIAGGAAPPNTTTVQIEGDSELAQAALTRAATKDASGS